MQSSGRDRSLSTIVLQKHNNEDTAPDKSSVHKRLLLSQLRCWAFSSSFYPGSRVSFQVQPAASYSAASIAGLSAVIVSSRKANNISLKSYHSRYSQLNENASINSIDSIGIHSVKQWRNVKAAAGDDVATLHVSHRNNCADVRKRRQFSALENRFQTYKFRPLGGGIHLLSYDYGRESYVCTSLNKTYQNSEKKPVCDCRLGSVQRTTYPPRH